MRKRKSFILIIALLLNSLLKAGVPFYHSKTVSNDLLDVAAYMCTKNGLYTQSNDILQKTLVNTRVFDSLSFARLNNNMGVNYLCLNEFDKANEHFKAAVSYFEPFKNLNDDNCTYNNIGVLQLLENKNDEAYNFLSDAVNNYKINAGINWGNVISYNLGAYYLQHNKKDLALDYFFKDLDKTENMGLTVKPEKTDLRLCYIIDEDNINYCREAENKEGIVDTTFYQDLIEFNYLQHDLDSLIAKGEMEQAYDLSLQKTEAKDKIIGKINDKEYDLAIQSYQSRKNRASITLNPVLTGLIIFGGAVMLMLFIYFLRRRSVARYGN